MLVTTCCLVQKLGCVTVYKSLNKSKRRSREDLKQLLLLLLLLQMQTPFGSQVLLKGESAACFIPLVLSLWGGR